MHSTQIDQARQSRLTDKVILEYVNLPTTESIIENVDGSSLIDDKTKKILHFSGKITRHAYKVIESDIQGLKDSGYSEEEIFEAVAVTSLFNYMDRMADALGAPVEGFQEMMAQMLES